MNILKFFDGKSWVSLYEEIVSNCLMQKRNLSDLDDLTEARKNLELDGVNNNTHYHDTWYLPKIAAVKEEAMSQCQQTALEVKEELRAVQASLFGQIMIQESEPDKPTEKQIWICNNTSNPHISIYKDGAWLKLTK